MSHLFVTTTERGGRTFTVELTDGLEWKTEGQASAYRESNSFLLTLFRWKKNRFIGEHQVIHGRIANVTSVVDDSIESRRQ